MTTHHDRTGHLPERSTRRRETAATRDDSPRVAGPVPIAVWRLDDHPEAEPGAGFAERMARRLVLTYTSHGDTVADVDHDPHLHGEARHAGRAYLTITDPTALPAPDQLRKPVNLVSLRWPRHADPSTADQLSALLIACQPIMAADASVVTAICPTSPGEPGDSFTDHEHALTAAAGQAGFTHVLQIVAISAPSDGDQYLYNATQAEATQAVAQAAAISDGRVLHVDLLVFHRLGSP